ncbi:LysM peptidoglycan-binding domain-containing protein [Gelidibacter mesophilus]|uniref:LysM peptidoglycan-binding domain-containing protein n=1 Tax=Gelidibacter mesophilus TaxID=169050 RepID=UPI0004165056|nr:LysM peptidoglycan-binding domain-containing protein [Gelidibacter mesophilus]
MKRLFVFLPLFFLCFYMGIAQECPKKHTVSNGETILSIAKRYSVTPFDLQQANPNNFQSIVAGDILIIPESKIKTPILNSSSDSIKVSVVSSSISYTVKYGDTKYSLAKRFEMSIRELESQNPHIISGLEAGHVLEIQNASTAHIPAPKTVEKKAPITPTKTIVSEAKPTIPKNSNPEVKSNVIESYRVVSGDTKFGLAKRFNTTIPELERTNPHIRNMLIVGQILKIPTDSGEAEEQRATNPVENQINDSREDLKEETSVIKEVQTDNIILEEKIAKPVAVNSEKSKINLPQERENGVPIIEQPKEIQTPEKVTVNNGQTDKIILQEKAVEAGVTPEKQPEELLIKKNETATSLETPSKDSVAQKESIESVVSTKDQPEEIVKASATATPSDTAYDLYKIKPKETLFDLSRRAGMTMSEFLILNPQLEQSVQIGSLIKMPKNDPVEKVVSNTPVASKVVRTTSQYRDLKASANTSQSKRVLFFLPFSKSEYDNFAENGYKFNSISDDFKRYHMEFYKGANIAIDSIRKMNLDITMDIEEAQDTKQTSKIQSLTKQNNYKDYDAIILPFYETMEEDLATFSEGSTIPVITASTIAHQITTNNLYSALPSINQQKIKVLDYMLSKQAHIIVLSDSYRTESKNFVSDYVPSADIINIKINGTFSESELLSKFKKDQLNFVVIDSERNSVFLNTTNILLGQLSNYSLQLAVLEASLVPDDGDVSQKRYRILKMIFPSLIPEKSTVSSKKFLGDYLKDYNVFPSRNTMFGFDITFDSLLRLTQEQSFENTAIYDITEYTQLKFNYEKNALGGYNNGGIYILQYDSGDSIRQAE